MVDTGDITNEIAGIVPKVQEFGANAVDIISILIFAVVLLGVVAFLTYLIILRLKFNKKIIIFEKIDGTVRRTKRDVAMEFYITSGGDTAFKIKKHKKTLPPPSIQSGPREYWYFIRSDGEWINFGMSDLDQASKEAGAVFLDKEARFARTQLQRGLKERYEEINFWQKHGALVMGVVTIVILGLMMWFLFDKWIDLAQTTNAGVETAGKVIQKSNTLIEMQKQLLLAMDNICTGGSGIQLNNPT